MGWMIGQKYFFKLSDGSCINGTIQKIDDSNGFVMIEVIDKYDNYLGFRADKIIKYELLTKLNKLNNQS